MWGNFLGYTGMPSRRFSFEKMSMTSEELANASIGVRGPNLGNTLFPQGSTLLFDQKYNYWDYNLQETLYNCPYSNVSDSFCNYIGPCNGAYESDSITSNAMLGILVALGVFYNILAWYWVQVLPGGVSVLAFKLLSSTRRGPSSLTNTFTSSEWITSEVLLSIRSQLLDWRDRSETKCHCRW